MVVEYNLVDSPLQTIQTTQQNLLQELYITIHINNNLINRLSLILLNSINIYGIAYGYIINKIIICFCFFFLF